MKRITKLFLIALLGIFLAACNKEDDQASNNSSSQIEEPSNLSSNNKYDAASKLWYEIDSQTMTAKVIKPQESTLQKAAEVYSGNVVIPDVIIVESKEYKVVAIAKDCFANSAVESVVIGKNISEIGENAFKDCEKLTVLTINNDEAVIDLSKVTIPEIVKIIVPEKLEQQYVEANPELTINEKDGEIIDDSIDALCEAFAKTQTDVLVEEARDWSQGSKYLTITYSNGNKYKFLLWKVEENIFDFRFNEIVSVNSEKIIIPTYITYNKEKYYIKVVPSFEVDKDIYISSIVEEFYASFSKNVFVDENSKTYTFKEGVLLSKDEKILEKHPNIAQVMIPESVTEIGSNAFAECSKLTSIEIPERITSIGGGAFYNCSGLTSVKLPQNITVIETSAFQDCSNLTSIDIPGNVTEIGIGAFADCEKLTSVTIPMSVTTIGNTAFASCENLTSIIIPEKVEHIGQFAFLRCIDLESINIPQSVKLIDRTALAFCEKLKSIKIETSYSVVEELLSEIPDGATIIVPESEFDKYVASCGTRLKINDREPGEANKETEEIPGQAQE